MATVSAANAQRGAPLLPVHQKARISEARQKAQSGPARAPGAARVIVNCRPRLCFYRALGCLLSPATAHLLPWLSGALQQFTGYLLLLLQHRALVSTELGAVDVANDTGGCIGVGALAVAHGARRCQHWHTSLFS